MMNRDSTKSLIALMASALMACGGGDANNPDGGGGGSDGGVDEACLPAGASLFVRTGDLAPGPGEPAYFASLGIAPTVGPLGTVAFSAHVGADAQNPDRAALYYFNGGTTLEPVVVEGTAIPAAAGRMPRSIQGASIIARDQVVGFQVVLNDGDKAALSWDPISKETRLRLAEGDSVGPAGEPFQMLQPFSNLAARGAFDEHMILYARYTPNVPTPFSVIHGLWSSHRDAAPTPLAIRGDAAPGFASGILYGVVDPEVQTTELQIAAAIVPVTNAGGGSEGAGLYRWNLASGAAPELLRTAANPGTNNAITVLRQLRLNRLGHVAFVEAGPGVQSGLIAESGTGLRTVGFDDDPAADFPGSTRGSVRSLAFLDDSRVVFTTELRGGDADGTTALWRDTASGAIELIAYDGMPVPAAGADATIDSLEQIHVRDADTMVIRAMLNNNEALLVWSEGTLTVALLSGRADGCSFSIRSMGVQSDLLPSAPAEVFGPGTGGAPRGITSDGYLAFYLQLIEDGVPSQALGIMKLP